MSRTGAVQTNERSARQEFSGRPRRGEGASQRAPSPRSASIPAESEHNFQAAVVRLAEQLGYKAYHPWSSIHSTSGWPDLALCKPPRLILAELKSDGGRLTRAQEDWIDALASCRGVEVHVWRPADWPHIVAVLQGRG